MKDGREYIYIRKRGCDRKSFSNRVLDETKSLVLIRQLLVRSSYNLATLNSSVMRSSSHHSRNRQRDQKSITSCISGDES